ncbi:hypothetical protein [Sediminibacillus albus]|uniref:Uncharacterized protein n=1 Tax=Sediminibacillus albus TaxID=407036 RepID=A0A1G9B4F2_9BACI|nr:hypothetical protein [Sediminibacillus albus]SDK34426.1 hypothetical protein SAMN05216243_2806 [Sediminibacillus albus]
MEKSTESETRYMMVKMNSMETASIDNVDPTFYVYDKQGEQTITFSESEIASLEDQELKTYLREYFQQLAEEASR